MRRGLMGALIVFVALAAACGSSSSATGVAAKLTAGHPVGVNPSRSSKMVCAGEARRDIAESLGVKPTAVTTPTWADDVYSCQYVYEHGTIGLSVKELADLHDTKQYFNELARFLGRQPGTLELGQGSFVTTDGSVVVRKDFKVLTVDVAQLPARFGVPPLVPSDVGVSVAATVMGCWTGS